MALYSYEALKKDGSRTQGVIDAPSQAAVKEQLVRQGLYPVSIEPAREGAREPWWRRLFAGGVTTKEKVLFTRQLLVLVRSGTPLVQALELLVEQFQGRMRSMLVIIKDEVKEGSSLADALKKYPNVFDTIYVQLVRAGEASGSLEPILERLTDYLEKREALAKQVKNALFMPMLQLIVAVCVVVLLLVKVVPRMVEVVKAQGKELPGTTQLLIAISNFVTSYYLFIGAFGIAIYMAVTAWKRTPAGGQALDRMRLRLPLVRNLTKTNAVVQFSYTLGLLLEGGVNLSEALDIVCDVIDNKILSTALRQARENIIKQGKIAEYLKQTGLFPSIAIYLIRTGENTGSLDTMLLTIAHNYEDELKELTGRLTAILGPVTLLLVAGVVGFIVAAIAVPMMSLGEGFG